MELGDLFSTNVSGLNDCRHFTPPMGAAVVFPCLIHVSNGGSLCNLAEFFLGALLAPLKLWDAAQEYPARSLIAYRISRVYSSIAVTIQ